MSPMSGPVKREKRIRTVEREERRYTDYASPCSPLKMGNRCCGGREKPIAYPRFLNWDHGNRDECHLAWELQLSERYSTVMNYQLHQQEPTADSRSLKNRDYERSDPDDVCRPFIFPDPIRRRILRTFDLTQHLDVLSFLAGFWPVEDEEKCSLPKLVQLAYPLSTPKNPWSGRHIENIPPFFPKNLHLNFSTRASFMGSPYKNSEKAGGIIQGRQSLNDFGQDQLRFPKPDEPKSSQVLIIGRESVVHWKENAGKNKDWRIADPLGKKHCFRRDCQSSQKHLKERMQVLITSSLHDQGSTTYSAIRAVSLPRSMLKGLECRTKMAHLKTLVRAQINIERKAKEYHKNSRFRCSQLSRKDRQKNRNKIKDLYDISGSGEFDCSAADSEDDHAPINVNPSNDCWNTTQNDARETARKTNQQDTDRRVLAVPYESYNGAIIGNRYVLRMLVNTKPCCEIYDVHDGFSSNNGMHLIAKAYSICGTKGKERDARVKNLKRNTKKPNLVDVIDQNGKKWLFFPYSSCSIIKSNTQGVPVDWLREGEYNLHFPSLNPYNRILSALEGRYPKSYASCLQSGQVEPENSPKGKNQRARDRQRRKRKENRLAKASMLDNTKTKGSTPDKDYSLTENLNLISTHRNSLDLDDDIQKVTPSSYVKVQERGNKILVSPTLSSYSIAGIENPNSVPTSRIEARDENPALTSPAWREIPSQRKGKSGEQCHCFRASFSNPREHRHTSNATAAERYLQALDTITGYGRFHDIDEHIWQRFTSGPAVGLKNRFFEILEELRMNFEIEKDTFRLELAQSKRQRMIDLLRISYSPVIRYRTSQLNRIPQMHSEEEYAAFKDYVFSIYGNENASRALQFLHETFDNSSYSEREELNLLESTSS